MTIDSKEISERYIDWLRDNLKIKNLSEDLVKVQTPFVDSQNDYIVIYVKKENNLYYLTDEGQTFYDLEISGVVFTEKRLKQLKEFVNAQGVQFNERSEEIFTKTGWGSLPQHKNDLLQAIINVSDIFITVQRNVKSLFYEEVQEYFKSKKIAASPNIYLEGGGGVKHKVDFLIPRVSREPQLVKTLNNPIKTSIEIELFKYVDIGKNNTIYKNSEKIIFINDSEKELKTDHAELIKSYDIRLVLWSEREETPIFD